jgi:hypothetical protein
MKKVFFAIAIAAALTLGSCNNFSKPEPVEVEQDSTELVLGEWTQTDSNSMHYNIDDSACIKMTVEDTGLCFECVGVDTFEVFQQVDSVTYNIPSEMCAEKTWRVLNEDFVKDTECRLTFLLDNAIQVKLNINFEE